MNPTHSLNPFVQPLADLLGAYPLSVATLPGELLAEYTRNENTARLSLSRPAGEPTGSEVLDIIDALRELGIDTLQVRKRSIDWWPTPVMQLIWPRTASGTPPSASVKGAVT